MKLRNSLFTVALTFVFATQICEANAQTMVKLNTLWEVKVGTTDYMTTTSPSERDLFTFRGAVAYVPATNVASSAILNRLYNGTSDHMTSPSMSEGSYSFDGGLGYPWTSQTVVPGLVGLSRIYNSAGDHATVSGADTISGYTTKEGLGRYGYQRYGNTAEVLNSLSGGGVTIKSNSIAGGSLWSWIWNGIEFIDHQDYGREMQAAIGWFDSAGRWVNPTEAGAKFSFPADKPGVRQGAPVLNNQNSGLTQTTRSIPLQFDPNPFGGDDAHPIAFSGMTLGKDITLNFNGMGPVAQYVTQIWTDTAIPSAQIELPTGYMPASFNRYFTYDAQNQYLVEVFPASNVCDGSDNSNAVTLGLAAGFSGYGGVIITNANQTAAMGVYGRTTAVSGSVTYFAMYNLIGCGSTSKWAAARAMDLPAGSTSLKTWVVSGSLASVVANMRELYVSGVN